MKEKEATIKKEMRIRARIVYAFMMVFSLAIVARILFLQLAEGDFWKQKALESGTKYFSIEANRGNIIDNEGLLIATSIPVFDVAMDVNSDPLSDEIFFRGVDSLSHCLAGVILKKNAQQIRNELIRRRKAGKHYFPIAAGISHKELNRIKTFPILRLGKYKGGLMVLQRSRRELPFSNLASRTIGIARAKKGKGLENAYDHTLRGTSGKRLMQKIAGDVWMPVNEENEVEPKDGNDIITSIDINIQDVAHHALLKQLQKQQAGKGILILMEVKTGEIRAMVNLSRVDSLHYIEAGNHAIAERMEPGSTFKLPSLMAALEAGGASPDEKADTEDGEVMVGAKEIRDSHDGGYGVIDMQEIFEKSSNVGTAKIVYKHFSKNPVAFVESLAKLGIDRKTEIDVEGEAQPLLYHPGDGHWSGTTLPAMSYGYEVMLTPLQILNFYNSVANGGTMVKPHLVKEIRSKGVTVKKFETEVLIPKICSDSTLHVARRMLEGVVEKGTASNLRNAYYRIAAKTGTTQIADNNRGYGIDRKTYRASLCGYFPAADPLYSMIIVVSSPSKNVYYGNDVAGPVFREVADKVYATSTRMHKSIEKDTSSLYSYTPYNMHGAFGDFVALSKKIALDISQVQDPILFVQGEKKKATISRIPDVTGTGLRDALYALEHIGCRVTVKGKGKVISQSVPPGQVVQKGTHITIKLG